MDARARTRLAKDFQLAGSKTRRQTMIGGANEMGPSCACDTCDGSLVRARLPTFARSAAPKWAAVC